MSRDNRKSFGYISHPKIQFKYAFLNSLFVSGIILLANLIVVYQLRSYAQSQPESESDVAMLLNITDFTLKMGFMTFAVAFLITFFSTLIITHRFVGPFISINRYIESLLKDDFDAKLHLRDSDEVHEVAEKLKSLSVKLKNK